MKIAILTAAVGFGLLAVPVAASAHTGSTVTCRATLSGHPENASPVWAYDTFVRVTKLTPAGEGTWKAHITDLGHFTTVPGATSDSGDTIAHKVTGVFTGRGDYTVTSASRPHCIGGEHYTGSAGPTTGQWPVHYFAQGAITTGIDPWHWDYRTCREHMSEDSVAGTSGHMAGLACRIYHRRPTHTPSAPATHTPPASPTPTPGGTSAPGEAPMPTPVNSDLPVTG
jgi:hypothetical protein